MMRLLQLFTFALAVTIPVFAQSTYGEITGVVTDSSGAAMVGTTVSVTETQTNQTRTTTTNNTGNYDFPTLLPGSYSVKAASPGFQTSLRTGIDLQIQQVARIDFRLNVGEQTQTVEVSGGAPLINTENATLGTVIENKSIVDLPLNGRDFLQLVALSSNVSSAFSVNGGSANGAATTRLGGQRANESFSVSGTRKEYTYYTLDGLSDTEPNFNAYIFLPSIDALQEFKVQTGIYSAEFGRELGQITASTKQGTNAFHGVLFEFLRNNALDALPFAFTSNAPQSAPFRQNNYGGTFGGPIVKNRLFFMSNFEGFRQRQTLTQVYSTPTQAMRNGDFSSILPGIKVVNPATKVPCPGNLISNCGAPYNTLDPVSVALLAYDPLPNVPGAGNVNNYLGILANSFYKDQINQRIDFVESPGSSWFGRYSWGHDRQTVPSLYLNGNDLQVHADQAMIGNTRILSPTLVNEARFGFDWFHNQNYYQTTGVPAFSVTSPTGPVAGLGLQLGGGWTTLDNGIPQMSIANYSAFGTPTEGPYDMRDVVLQWNDGLSWTHGAHSFKFGVDIVRTRFDTEGNAFARGSFSAGQYSGYAMADYMMGILGGDLKSVTENVAQMRATGQAYYAADTWKIRPNLTIDAGLRYEFIPPWSYRNNTESNWYIPCISYQPNAAAAGCPAPTLVRIGTGSFYQGLPYSVFNPAVPTARNGSLGANLVQSDYTNFAPRLGVAYNLGSWVFHAGGGIFYAQDIGAAIYDQTRNLAGRITPAANPITSAPNITWENPYLLNGANGCGTTAPVACITTPGPLAMQYNQKTPYMEQWTASVQRQLGTSTVLEVDYLGSEGHHLQRYHYLNQAVPGTTSTASRTPWPQFGTFQYIDGDADSSYEAATVKVNHRLSHGFTLMSAFTWGKAIDDGSDIRIETNDIAPQNDACINPCERGLSQFNQTFRWVTSGLYALPFGKGQRFMNRGGVANAILGGWNISSILTLGSGFPDSVSTGTNRSGSGSDRPNAVPGQNVSLSNPTTAEWFNIEAFSENAVGQLGNVGRNVVIGPGIRTWDFSALKQFHITEQRYIEFRFECFNCSNHPNFADPSLSLVGDAINSSTGQPIRGTGAFGTINSLRSGIFMRELQFALKAYF